MEENSLLSCLNLKKIHYFYCLKFIGSEEFTMFNLFEVRKLNLWGILTWLEYVNLTAFETQKVNQKEIIFEENK